MAEDNKAKKKEEAKESAENPVPSETSVPPVEGEGAGASGEARETAGSGKPAEIDWKDRFARLLADFDNYKKRMAREREDTYRYAESDILRDVLPAVDNLALALDSAKDKSDDPFVKGVRLVYDTLLASLKEHGAEPFDSVGEALDTERMEAIATLPSSDVEEGKVSIESKKGWMLRDKVLRPAQVVVSAGAPATTGAEGAGKPQDGGRPAAEEDANGR